jgi:hypothetical protein
LWSTVADASTPASRRRWTQAIVSARVHQGRGRFEFRGELVEPFAPRGALRHRTADVADHALDHLHDPMVA